MKQVWAAGLTIVFAGCNPLPDVDLPAQPLDEKVRVPQFIPRQQIAITTDTEDERREVVETELEERVSSLRNRADRLRDASLE